MQLWRILIAVALCSGVLAVERRKHKGQFDLFKLVRQWAPSFCDFHDCSSAPTPPFSTDFTIHGLWPDFDDGTFPSFCNKTDQFDIDLVRDLLPQLETEWPSYTVRGGDDFWAYEYAKHGTCAKATFRNEHEYFAGVLGLNEEYNLLRALRKANITPSNSREYPASDMEAAIEDMTQVPDSCIVHCKKGEVDEVDICLDKQNPPRPIACPDKPQNSCGDIVLRTLRRQTESSMAAEEA